jgi:hypothetical protein
LPAHQGMDRREPLSRIGIHCTPNDAQRGAASRPGQRARRGRVEYPPCQAGCPEGTFFASRSTRFACRWPDHGVRIELVKLGDPASECNSERVAIAAVGSCREERCNSPAACIIGATETLQGRSGGSIGSAPGGEAWPVVASGRPGFDSSANRPRDWLPPLHPCMRPWLPDLRSSGRMEYSVGTGDCTPDDEDTLIARDSPRTSASRGRRPSWATSGGAMHRADQNR